MDARAARLLDEQEVRDACMRFFAGWDRRDAALFRSAFTADATSETGDAQVTRSTVSDALTDGQISTPSMPFSSHAPSSQVVTVTGDTATADTMVTCHIVTDKGEVLVRGLRYLDDLVRTADGWRIRHKKHLVLWQYDARRIYPHI